MAYEQAIQALADPTRRAIFERLRKGEQPVGVLADGLDVTRPAVSQHLKVLEGAGLVRARQEGTRRIYSVEIRGLEELRRYLDRMWGDVLAVLAAEAGPAARTKRTARRRPAPAKPRSNRRTKTRG